MAEIRYVNRVAQPHVESERELLNRLQTESEVDSVSAPKIVEEPIEIADTLNKEQGTPVPVSEIEDQSGGIPGHLTTAQLLVALTDRQIRFEARVIRALKHIGLDTRKFFGE